MNEPCEECHGTGTRERVWDSAPCVCWCCDGNGWTQEYEPPVVITMIVDKRQTADVNAAWERFRARVAAVDGKSKL